MFLFFPYFKQPTPQTSQDLKRLEPVVSADPLHVLNEEEISLLRKYRVSVCVCLCVLVCAFVFVFVCWFLENLMEELLMFECLM